MQRQIRIPSTAAVVAALVVAAAAVVVGPASPASADPSCSIYWTGATSADWTVATNWSFTDGGASAGRVPMDGDAVCMSTTSVHAAITFPSGTTSVAQISFARTPSVNPSLTIAAGSLTVGTANTSVINGLSVQSGSTFAGSAMVTTLAVTDATLDGPGTLTVVADGTGTFENVTLGSGAALVNQGVSTQCKGFSGVGSPSPTFSNAGTFSVLSSCSAPGLTGVDVTNAAGASMNLRSNYELTKLTNFGQLIITGTVEGVIDNHGAVQVIGQLRLTGGTFDVGPNMITGGGYIYSVGAGVEIHGTGGTITPYLVGVLGQVTGTLSANYVQFAGAGFSLSGPGELTVLNGGEVTGPSILENGFDLTIASPYFRISACDAFEIDTGAVIHNKSSMYTAFCHLTYAITGDGTGSFVNEAGAALGNQSGPYTPKRPFEITTPFTNDGTLYVGDGTKFTIGDLTNLSDGTLTGGSYKLAGNLVLPDPVTTLATSSFILTGGTVALPDGSNAFATLTTSTTALTTSVDVSLPSPLTTSGSVTVTAGTATINGFTQTAGTTSVAAGAALRSGPFGDQPVDIAGGTLVGRGTVAGDITVAATLVAGGTPGSLTLAGTSVLADSATTTVALSSSTPVAAAQGLVTCTQSLHVGGTLAVSAAAGLDPAVGTTYTIFDAASGVSGTFATLTGAVLTSGKHLVVSYTADSVVLTVSDAPAVSVGSASLAEGNTGRSVLEVPVTLSKAAAAPVTVHYATPPGTATRGSDYVATSGTLTIPTGTTTAHVGVTIIGDTTYEPDETFALTISNPVGADLGAASATQTILNDDAPPPPLVTSASPATIGQNASNVTVTVTGSGFVPGALVGFGGSDVTAVSQTVVSSTTIVAVVSASATATIGARDIKVRNPGVVGTCTGCFAVAAKPAPAAVSRGLAVGAEHRRVILTGANFQPGATVTITGYSGGITATATYVSAAELVLSITVARTAVPGSYTVRVLDPDGGFGGCPSCFTLTGGPQIASISPNTASRGSTQSVTISGSGFVDGATVTGSSGVGFAAIDVVGPSTITATMTVSATAVSGTNKVIKVTNPSAAGYGSATLLGMTIT